MGGEHECAAAGIPFDTGGVSDHDGVHEAVICLGAGNLLAPFFGGFAATGAIARTTVNIRSGGRSPFASAFHAVFLLLAMLLAAPVLGKLPLAGMAALLLTVAWRMAEGKHFLHILRVAPRSDVAVLLACFSLTVLFDMVVGVTVGVVLAALLLMRRMSEVFRTRALVSGDEGAHPALPRGTWCMSRITTRLWSPTYCSAWIAFWAAPKKRGPAIS